MAQQLRGQDFIVDTQGPQINPNNIRTMKKDIALSKGLVQPQKEFVAPEPLPQRQPQQAPPKTISATAPQSEPPKQSAPAPAQPASPGEFKIITGGSSIKTSAKQTPATQPLEQPLKPSKPVKLKEGDVVILEAWEVGAGSGAISNYGQSGSPEIPSAGQNGNGKNGEMKTLKVNLGLKENKPAQNGAVATSPITPNQNQNRAPINPSPQPPVQIPVTPKPEPKPLSVPISKPEISQAQTPPKQIIPAPKPEEQLQKAKEKEEFEKKEQIFGFNPEVQLMIKKGAAPVKPVEKKTIPQPVTKQAAPPLMAQIPPDMIPPPPPSMAASKMASASQDEASLKLPTPKEGDRPSHLEEYEPQELPGYEWIEPVDVPGRKKTPPPKDKFTQEIEKVIKAGKQAFAQPTPERPHPKPSAQSAQALPSKPQATPEPEKPKDARTQLRETLAEIHKQKSVLSTEKDAILKNIDLQAKEIRNSTQALQSGLTELLRKKENLENTILADAMAHESQVEEKLRQIIASQRAAKGLLQEEELERQREEKETERKMAEKTRWDIEDKILKLIDQMEANKLQYQAMLAQEERLHEKKLDMLHREETIDLEEQKINCELELLDIDSKQKDLSSQYSALLPAKNIINKSLHELSDEKLAIDQELVSLESKEKEVEGADRRKTEEARQNIENKRRSAAQAYLQKVKEKDKIEQELTAVTKSVQEFSSKEQKLKDKIISLERQIKSKRKK